MDKRFKVGLEKLQRGWNVTVPAADKESALSLIDEIEDGATAENGGDGAEAPRFEVGLRRLKDGTYRVTVYQSKLSQAQAFIKERFQQYRDEVEAPAGGGEESL